MRPHDLAQSLQHSVSLISPLPLPPSSSPPGPRLTRMIPRSLTHHLPLNLFETALPLSNGEDRTRRALGESTREGGSGKQKRQRPRRRCRRRRIHHPSECLLVSLTLPRDEISFPPARRFIPSPFHTSTITTTPVVLSAYSSSQVTSLSYLSGSSMCARLSPYWRVFLFVPFGRLSSAYLCLYGCMYVCPSTIYLPEVLLWIDALKGASTRQAAAVLFPILIALFS